MKFIFRWAFRLALLLIVLLVALVLLKDTLVKSVAEYRVRAKTGLEVKIGKFEIGLLTPTVTIEDFVLYNPAEFGGSPFVDFPELHLEYDWEALARQKLHLKLARINLRELNIVENLHGQTNVHVILSRLEKEKNDPREGTQKSRFDFDGIDTLNLTLGKVKYSNLKRPIKNKEFNLGIQNEILHHVQSEEDLAGVFFKILLRQGITFFTGPPPGKTASPRAVRDADPSQSAAPKHPAASAAKP